jgi:hypothetical protein
MYCVNAPTIIAAAVIQNTNIKNPYGVPPFVVHHLTGAFYCGD